MSPEDVLKIVDPSHNSSPLRSQNMSRRNFYYYYKIYNTTYTSSAG